MCRRINGRLRIAHYRYFGCNITALLACKQAAIEFTNPELQHGVVPDTMEVFKQVALSA
jgi:hypothetical protein